MPRIVPSEVVTTIDDVLRRIVGRPGQPHFLPKDAGYLRAILTLIDQIPDELRPTGPDLPLFMMAIATIREQCDSWVGGRGSGALHGLPEFEHREPVKVLSEILSRCPDESPASASSELAFVRDDELRRNLQLDLGAINVALSNGEWKAATVLAGALCEALLLWKIQQQPSGVVSTAAGSQKKGTDPERWDLSDYIEIATALNLIDKQTTQLVDLGREFRNLIHPGRAARLKQKCDRGTALATVAAVDHIIRDITP